MYLGMAIKANWNAIVVGIGSVLGLRHHMVYLHLHPTKTVTDATAPMAGNQ